MITATRDSRGNQTTSAVERSGATRDPLKAQQALSRLSAAERKAWLDAAGEQGAIPEPMNRQQRRAAEKLKKRR